MKYRIVQKNLDGFLPQYKRILGWGDFKDYGYVSYFSLTFKTLKEAEEYLKNYHKKYHSKKFPIVVKEIEYGLTCEGCKK